MSKGMGDGGSRPDTAAGSPPNQGIKEKDMAQTATAARSKAADTRKPAKAIERPGLESWQNDSAGIVVVKKFDHRGELAKDEIVRGGQITHLTAEERKMNQDLAGTPEQDLFSSGVMRPVRILSDADDAAEIAANANLMAESEMRKLVKGHPQTFAAKLAEISNPVTLQRLLTVAKEEDVANSRVEAVQARLMGAGPSVQEVMTTAGPRPMDGIGRGVTPQ
jgi:hypothetical protein